MALIFVLIARIALPYISKDYSNNIWIPLLIGGALTTWMLQQTPLWAHLERVEYYLGVKIMFGRLLGTRGQTALWRLFYNTIFRGNASEGYQFINWGYADLKIESGVYESKLKTHKNAMQIQMYDNLL